MDLRKEIIGQRNGRLVVVGVVGVKNGKTIIKVVCDCGKTKEIVRGNFHPSGTKSCGCLNLENVMERKKSWISRNKGVVS